jgi:hypothetical protein
VIGEGLKSNHTLLGIHLMGNEAKVDELGFVMPEKTMDSASFHVFTRIPRKNIWYINTFRAFKNWLSWWQTQSRPRCVFELLDLRGLVTNAIQTSSSLG